MCLSSTLLPKMENLLQFFLVNFMPFLLLMFIIPKLASGKRSANSTHCLPPGPWRLPVIGNLHLLIGSDLPHHRLRDLAKKYRPLMHLQLGELFNIVVSSPEIAQEMMKTHDVNFAQRPSLLATSFYESANFIFAPYGDNWRQLSRICTQELLNARRVQSFQSIREEEVSNLLGYLYSCSNSPINLSEKIFSLTNGITAMAAFGKKCKDREDFLAVVKEGLKISGGFSVSEVFPSQKWLHWISGPLPTLEQSFHKADKIADRIIDECREDKAATSNKGKANSLLDVLLDLQENGDLAVPLENRNIKAIMLDIFVAGSDTSSTALEWAMLEMLKNPKVMEKAQAEVRQVFRGKEKVDETCLHKLKYLNLIIKETLRLHPPEPFLLPRESRERCAINGYDVPVKTKIIVNAWAIERDPRYWTEAEQFYPERFTDSSVDVKGTNFQFIPFGAGRRMCPDLSFALADIELPLAALLFHFDWKLPSGTTHENLDMTESFGLTMRRKEDLYVIPVRFSSSRS